MSSHYKEPDIVIDDKDFHINLEDLMLFLKDPIHQEIYQIYEDHVKPLPPANVCLDIEEWTDKDIKDGEKLYNITN